MSQAWECPRCGKMNAMWNPSCDCPKPVSVTRSNGTDMTGSCYHAWVIQNHHWHCTRCGADGGKVEITLYHD